jgi:integrase
MVLKASLSKLSLHDLRRSAITNWPQRLPILVVQQLAGHSDMATTREYYTTVRPEDMAAASSIVNEIVAGRKV